MQLKIERSQRQSGVVSKAVMFCVDARIFLSADEQANVTRYKLGNQLIYSSEAAKRHANASLSRHAVAREAGNYAIEAQDRRTGGLIAKSIGNFVMGLFHGVAASLALNITIDSLQRGQHIECKDLNEVRDAENALRQACLTLKDYLETAATFNGAGVLIIDYSGDEPVIIAQPVLLPSPVASAPIVETGSPGFAATTAADGSFGTQSFGAAQEPNAFQPAIEWWNRLTHEQRKWLMAIGGVVVLIILYEIL
jgi:hypothetical protein